MVAVSLKKKKKKNKKNKDKKKKKEKKQEEKDELTNPRIPLHIGTEGIWKEEPSGVPQHKDPAAERGGYHGEPSECNRQEQGYRRSRDRII